MATAVDELLDMLFDMIDEAKNAAFSGDKCVIDRDKALDLIEDAKKQLPVDLAEARKILSARNEYLAAAKREAEEIRKRAEIEANQMVSEAPVMNQARQKAREIVAHAEAEAKKTAGRPTNTVWTCCGAPRMPWPPPTRRCAKYITSSAPAWEGGPVLPPPGSPAAAGCTMPRRICEPQKENDGILPCRRVCGRAFLRPAGYGERPGNGSSRESMQKGNE